MTQKILRLPAVKSLTGLSRSTVYQKISTGAFPHAISLGARSVGWLEDEVQAWIEQQIATTRKVRGERAA